MNMRSAHSDQPKMRNSINWSLRQHSGSERVSISALRLRPFIGCHFCLGIVLSESDTHSFWMVRGPCRSDAGWRGKGYLERSA